MAACRWWRRRRSWSCRPLAGAAGQVVPVHLGRQHSWLASGKWTAVSPPAPDPVFPGFAQWLPEGDGGPGDAAAPGRRTHTRRFRLRTARRSGSPSWTHARVHSVGGGLSVLGHRRSARNRDETVRTLPIMFTAPQCARGVRNLPFPLADQTDGRA